MNDVEYLEAILKGIVTFPEEIKVEKTLDSKGVLLSLTISKNDMGRVIGKEGATAKAIRTLMHTYGYNVQASIFVKILEPVN